MASKCSIVLVSLGVGVLNAQYQFNQTLRIHQYEEQAVTTIFSHGLAADHQQADFYKGLFCTKNYTTFDYPDAPEKLFKRNYHTGPAQQSEMDSLGYVIDATLEHNQPVVFYGLSRGASVIVNVVGKRSAAGYRLPNIRAIILESPFAHAEDTIQAYAQQLGLPVFFVRFLAKQFFKEYHKTKNAPISWIEYIPRDIPILFICSAEDTVVPVQSTRYLYNTIRNLGHEHVYLVEFPASAHANILWGIHSKEYHSVIHAFYHKYHLPHDESLAQLGTARLEMCRSVG